MKKGMSIPVSFRKQDLDLVRWVSEQKSKKRLGFNTFSAVIRDCIKKSKEAQNVQQA